MTSVDDALLAVEGVSQNFGGVQAVRDCSFVVRSGHVTGLIGPNGAGKSTLMEIIAGGLRPSRGRVVLRGEDITGKLRSTVGRMGLVRTFQTARVFPRLPLMENLLIGRQVQRGESLARAWLPPLWRSQEDELRARAEELLEEVGLSHRRDALGGELSGGQMKLLEIARALMANPTLLLLDEPIAGVNPRLVDTVVAVIERLRGRGIEVLLVEHNLSFVGRVCSDVIVMAEGTVLAQGDLDTVRADRRVIDAYLGSA